MSAGVARTTPLFFFVRSPPSEYTSSAPCAWRSGSTLSLTDQAMKKPNGTSQTISTKKQATCDA